MQFNINAYNSYYFVGIGGISMSSLALILKRSGKEVKGYDRVKSDATQSLEAEGITVYYETTENNCKGCDIAVFTAAIAADNPEMKYINEAGIPAISRAELLGAIAKEYPNSIAVAGTHGKSTTCGILSQIFLSFKEADPSILIGAKLPCIHSTFRTGHDGNFVFEACEYKDAFLKFFPTVSVVLNVELDHIDYFHSLEEMENSFQRFINNTAERGCVIVNKDSVHAIECMEGYKRKFYTYSITDEKADFYAKDIRFDHGLPSYTLVFKGREVFRAELSIPGEHNISNSLAAVAAAFMSKVPDEAIIKGLKDFRGVGRRFEYKGKVNGALVYDDYAHHPDELAATIAAVRTMEACCRLVVAFQPHTYTRTSALFEDFVRELGKPDVVLVAEIYAARERNTVGISSRDLVERIPGAEYCETLRDVTQRLRQIARPGDVILTVGAGDIYRAGEAVLR